VAAIFYVENSHGHYGGLGQIADALGASKSVLPANIRPNMWNKLAGEHGDVNKLSDNITAGVKLIKRISDRIENPTVERVATLYNSLAKEKVTEYGARVGQIFREHKWGKEIPTLNKSKSNQIEKIPNGKLNVTVPSINSLQKSSEYLIDKFSELNNHDYLNKALNNPRISQLSSEQLGQFLTVANLKDYSNSIENNINQTLDLTNQSTQLVGVSDSSLDRAYAIQKNIDEQQISMGLGGRSRTKTYES
jgi:hypothetical protein